MELSRLCLKAEPATGEHIYYKKAFALACLDFSQLSGLFTLAGAFSNTRVISAGGWKLPKDEHFGAANCKESIVFSTLKQENLQNHH
jgi:hypothetical protein